MLASDLNNPEFVNAQNPDSLLHVEFYMHEPIDKWASEQETQKLGRKKIVKKPPVPYVRIMRPGDQTSILQVAVREEHKQRFSKQWLYFQMQEGLLDDGHNIPGWKIEEWDYLKDQSELLRDLKHARFYTVEQLAGMSDHQIQQLGIAGPGLAQEAKKALRQHTEGLIKEVEQQKEAEIQELKAQNEAMQKQMQAILEKLDSQPKKPGRKSKVVTDG